MDGRGFLPISRALVAAVEEIQKAPQGNCNCELCANHERWKSAALKRLEEMR